MKKALIVLAVIAAFVAGFFIFLNNKNSSLGMIRIGEKTEVFIEYATTGSQRVKGLSNRENLPQNQGLLFVFEKPDFHKFWMKDMYFPIDIIWIDENWKIIDITKNISPETYPKTFSPKLPAKYVLEVNADFGENSKINIGDRIFGASTEPHF